LQICQMLKNKKFTALIIGATLLVAAIVLILHSVNQHPLKDSGSKDSEEYSTAYLCSLFNKLDSKVNEGRGYSEYLNTDGFPTGALLAWSESYLIQACANMYRVTNDLEYLNKLHNHVQSVLANRDDKIGQKDYKNELVPSWGTNKYTKHGEWFHSAVVTGMIIYPMLEYAQLAKESGIEKYSIVADNVIQQVQESIKYHDREWKVDHYVFPEDFYKIENCVLPLSQQATIGRSLLLLYELTCKEEYCSKASLIAKLLKGLLQNIGNGYKLGLSPGEITDENKVGDISHSTITIHFAYLVYKNDIVFDKEDILRFTNTINNLAQANENHFPKYLDGTGNFDYEVTAGQYAFLAEFDREVYDLITDLFFNHLKIDQTAKYMREDWWGTVMLGLSRIALFQSNLE